MNHIVETMVPYLDIITIAFLLVLIVAEVRPAFWHLKWTERKLARQKARFLFLACLAFRNFAAAFGREEPDYIMMIFCGLMVCGCINLLLIKSKKAPNPIKVTAYTFDEATKEFKKTVLGEKRRVNLSDVRLPDGASGYLFSAAHPDGQETLIANHSGKDGYQLKKIDPSSIYGYLNSEQSYYFFMPTRFAKDYASFTIAGLDNDKFASHQLTICVEQKNNETFASLVEYAYED